MQDLSEINKQLSKEVYLSIPGYQDRIIKMINENPLVTDYTNKNGDTFLMELLTWAHNEFDIIDFVLEKMTNFEAVNLSGLNAFDIAVENDIHENTKNYIGYKTALQILGDE